MCDPVAIVGGTYDKQGLQWSSSNPRQAHVDREKLRIYVPLLLANLQVTFFSTVRMAIPEITVLIEEWFTPRKTLAKITAFDADLLSICHVPFRFIPFYYK